MTINNDTELFSTREALLRYFHSNASAHGTYLLTIALLTFTALQVLNYFKFSGSFLWFPTENIFVSLVFSTSFTASLYMVMRIIYWNSMINCVLWAKPFDLEDPDVNRKIRARNTLLKALCYGLQIGDTSLTLLVNLYLTCDYFTKERHTRLKYFYYLHSVYVAIWGIVAVSILVFLAYTGISILTFNEKQLIVY